jgi:hypothetical protein
VAILAVTKDVQDELFDLLNGLKVARDKMERGDWREGKEIMEQVGVRLSNLINGARVVR